MIQPPQQIAGYVVLEPLGSGGMGDVFLARHEVLERYVAIKVLRVGAGSGEAELATRFVAEARAAASIDHPVIVHIFDCDFLPDGRPYIVMEYLRGLELRDALDLDPPLRADTRLIAAILGETARGLGAAHARKIIHRDIKPDNIFLRADPHQPKQLQVKVLDFGIAKLARRTTSGAQTQTGVFFGTPRYMAPEQCRDVRQVDGRTDIYSLGCVAYELLSGKAPFETESFVDLLISQATLPAQPLASVAPTVPEPLAHLVDRMLAKDPKHRPQSMKEVVAEIAKFLDCTPHEIKNALNAPASFPQETTLSSAPDRPSLLPTASVAPSLALDTSPAATASQQASRQSSGPTEATAGHLRSAAGQDEIEPGDTIFSGARKTVSNYFAPGRTRSFSLGLVAVTAALALTLFIRNAPPEQTPRVGTRQQHLHEQPEPAPPRAQPRQPLSTRPQLRTLAAPLGPWFGPLQASVAATDGQTAPLHFPQPPTCQQALGSDAPLPAETPETFVKAETTATEPTPAPTDSPDLSSNETNKATSAEPATPLTREQVYQVMDNYRAAFEDCNLGTKKALLIEFALRGETGQVSHPRVSGLDIPSTSCVTRVVRQIEFPPAQAGMFRIRYPFRPDHRKSVKKVVQLEQPEESTTALPERPTQSAVRKILRSIQADVASCGDGLVMVNATVAGDSGRIIASEIHSQSIATKNCLRATLLRLRFPKFTKHSIKVRFPFRL